MSATTSDGAVSGSESDYSVEDLPGEIQRLQQALGASYQHVRVTYVDGTQPGLPGPASAPHAAAASEPTTALESPEPHTLHYQQVVPPALQTSRAPRAAAVRNTAVLAGAVSDSAPDSSGVDSEWEGSSSYFGDSDSTATADDPDEDPWNEVFGSAAATPGVKLKPPASSKSCKQPSASHRGRGRGTTGRGRAAKAAQGGRARAEASGGRRANGLRGQLYGVVTDGGSRAAAAAAAASCGGAGGFMDDEFDLSDIELSDAEERQQQHRRAAAAAAPGSDRAARKPVAPLSRRRQQQQQPDADSDDEYSRFGELALLLERRTVAKTAAATVDAATAAARLMGKATPPGPVSQHQRQSTPAGVASAGSDSGFGSVDYPESHDLALDALLTEGLFGAIEVVADAATTDIVEDVEPQDSNLGSAAATAAAAAVELPSPRGRRGRGRGRGRGKQAAGRGRAAVNANGRKTKQQQQQQQQEQGLAAATDPQQQQQEAAPSGKPPRSRGKRKQLQVDQLTADSADQQSHAAVDAKPGADTAAVVDAATAAGEQALIERDQNAVVPMNSGAWRERLKAMQHALEANRQLQVKLREMLQGVDKALESNWHQQVRVKAADQNRKLAVAQQRALAAVAATADQAAAGGCDGDGGGSALVKPPLVNLTLGANKPLFQSKYWKIAGTHECAPLPPKAREVLKVAQRDNPQLVGRLLSWRLGKWTPTEEAQLREGVRLGAIELIYKKELEDLEKSNPTTATLIEFQTRMNALRDARLDEPHLRNAVARFTKQHWDSVAAAMKLLPNAAGGTADGSTAAGSSRTGEECERHWECHLSEGALREWSSAELQHLSALVQQHGTKWSLIAQQLGTGRPPGTVVQAYVKYIQSPASGRDTKGVYLSQPRFVLQELEQQQLLLQQQMETDLGLPKAALGATAAAAAAAAAGALGDLQGLVAGNGASGMMALQQQQQQRRYTNEESRRVLQLASVGAGWQQIGDVLGIKPKDVSNLYRRLCAAAGRKAGAWSPEEDQLLLSAVQTYGRKFAAIEKMKLVPGRTQRQMKDRYRAVLNPDIDHGPVTEEEVVLLVQVVSQHKQSFPKVMWDKLQAEHFPRRATAKLRAVYNAYTAANGDVQKVVERQQFGYMHKMRRLLEEEQPPQPPPQPPPLPAAAAAEGVAEASAAAAGAAAVLDSGVHVAVDGADEQQQQQRRLGLPPLPPQRQQQQQQLLPEMSRSAKRLRLKTSRRLAPPPAAAAAAGNIAAASGVSGSNSTGAAAAAAAAAGWSREGTPTSGIRERSPDDTADSDAAAYVISRMAAAAAGGAASITAAPAGVNIGITKQTAPSIHETVVCPVLEGDLTGVGNNTGGQPTVQPAVVAADAAVMGGTAAAAAMPAEDSQLQAMGGTAVKSVAVMVDAPGTAGAAAWFGKDGQHQTAGAPHATQPPGAAAASAGAPLAAAAMAGAPAPTAVADYDSMHSLPTPSEAAAAAPAAGCPILLPAAAAATPPIFPVSTSAAAAGSRSPVAAAPPSAAAAAAGDTSSLSNSNFAAAAAAGSVSHSSQQQQQSQGWDHRPWSNTGNKTFVWSTEAILYAIPGSHMPKPPDQGVYRMTWPAYAAHPDPRTTAQYCYVELPDRPLIPTLQQHSDFQQWMRGKLAEHNAWKQHLLDLAAAPAPPAAGGLKQPYGTLEGARFSGVVSSNGMLNPSCGRHTGNGVSQAAGSVSVRQGDGGANSRVATPRASFAGSCGAAAAAAGVAVGLAVGAAAAAENPGQPSAAATASAAAATAVGAAAPLAAAADLPPLPRVPKHYRNGKRYPKSRMATAEHEDQRHRRQLQKRVEAMRVLQQMEQQGGGAAGTSIGADTAQWQQAQAQQQQQHSSAQYQRQEQMQALSQVPQQQCMVGGNGAFPIPAAKGQAVAGAIPSATTAAANEDFAQPGHVMALDVVACPVAAGSRTTAGATIPESAAAVAVDEVSVEHDHTVASNPTDAAAMLPPLAAAAAAAAPDECFVKPDGESDDDLEQLLDRVLLENVELRTAAAAAPTGPEEGWNSTGGAAAAGAAAGGDSLLGHISQPDYAGADVSGQPDRATQGPPQPDHGSQPASQLGSALASLGGSGPPASLDPSGLRHSGPPSLGVSGPPASHDPSGLCHPGPPSLGVSGLSGQPDPGHSVSGLPSLRVSGTPASLNPSGPGQAGAPRPPAHLRFPLPPAEDRFRDVANIQFVSWVCEVSTLIQKLAAQKQHELLRLQQPAEPAAAGKVLLKKSKASKKSQGLKRKRKLESSAAAQATGKMVDGGGGAAAAADNGGARQQRQQRHNGVEGMVVDQTVENGSPQYQQPQQQQQQQQDGVEGVGIDQTIEDGSPHYQQPQQQQQQQQQQDVDQDLRHEGQVEPEQASPRAAQNASVSDAANRQQQHLPLLPIQQQQNGELELQHQLQAVSGQAAAAALAHDLQQSAPPPPQQQQQQDEVIGHELLHQDQCAPDQLACLSAPAAADESPSRQQQQQEEEEEAVGREHDPHLQDQLPATSISGATDQQQQQQQQRGLHLGVGEQLQLLQQEQHTMHELQGLAGQYHAPPPLNTSPLAYDTAQQAQQQQQQATQQQQPQKCHRVQNQATSHSDKVSAHLKAVNAADMLLQTAGVFVTLFPAPQAYGLFLQWLQETGQQPVKSATTIEQLKSDAALLKRISVLHQPLIQGQKKIISNKLRLASVKASSIKGTGRNSVSGAGAGCSSSSKGVKRMRNTTKQQQQQQQQEPPGGDGEGAEQDTPAAAAAAGTGADATAPLAPGGRPRRAAAARACQTIAAALELNKGRNGSAAQSGPAVEASEPSHGGSAEQRVVQPLQQQRKKQKRESQANKGILTKQQQSAAGDVAAAVVPALEGMQQWQQPQLEQPAIANPSSSRQQKPKRTRPATSPPPAAAAAAQLALVFPAGPATAAAAAVAAKVTAGAAQQQGVVQSDQASQQEDRQLSQLLPTLTDSKSPPRKRQRRTSSATAAAPVVAPAAAAAAEVGGKSPARTSGRSRIAVRKPAGSPSQRHRPPKLLNPVDLVGASAGAESAVPAAAAAGAEKQSEVAPAPVLSVVFPCSAGL